MSAPEGIEKEFSDRLVGDAQLRALVGDRIYPGTAKQGAARPYVVYKRSSTDPKPHFGGGGDFAIAVIEVRAVSDAGEYTQIKTIAERLRLLLHGWSDRSRNISACLLDRYQDATERPAGGKERGPEVVVLDFRLQYTQATA